jgi:hypothetical protein
MLLAVLIGMFIWATPTRRQGAETASLLNMQNPRYAIYLSFYITVVAAGQAITMYLSFRYAKIVGRRWTRRGLLIVGTGAGAILVYCAMRYVEIVGVRLGADMSPWDPIQWVAGDAGSLLELVGWTIPAWGPALSMRRRWIRDYRAYQRLRPLWAALHQATPTIAAGRRPSRLADLLLMRDLEHRLYRRVIEIRDGQLAVRPYLSPADVEAANRYAATSGLTGERLCAVTEAYLLHTALRSKNNQAAVSAEPATFSDVHGDNLTGEVEWLTSVADAFVRLPTTSGATIAVAKEKRSQCV